VRAGWRIRGACGRNRRAREVIWEAFLGLWLTFKGFKPVAGDTAETVDVRAGAGSD
jgi:hypothetical protein